MNVKKLSALACTLLVATLARADWAEDLHQKFPATRGATIAPAFAGFKSVVKGQEIVFVSDDQSIMINGDVIDLKTKTSLTQELREKNRPKADLKKLSSTPAIELSKGKSTVRVFSDPDCPFCQQLEKSLAQLEGVRVLIYSLVELQTPPIIFNGLIVEVEKKLSSRENDIFIYQVSNPGQGTAVLKEAEFDGDLVQAVSIHPTPTLKPGQKTRVMVLARKDRKEQ